MQKEVAAEVTAGYVGSTVLHKKHYSLIHLVISYEAMLHNMQVPKLHHLFLSLIDISELIQLLSNKKKI